MKLRASTLVPIALLTCGMAQAQSSEAPDALHSLAAFIGWQPGVGSRTDNPLALLTSKVKDGSGRDAMQLRQLLVSVAGRKAARIRELSTLLNKNKPELGEVPFEDSFQFRRPEDEEVYIFLLFRPGTDYTARRSRERVASILESYDDDKALRAIGIGIEALTLNECWDVTPGGQISAMLCVLVRHPSPEALRSIVRALTPGEGKWVNKEDSYDLLTHLAAYMAESPFSEKWKALFRSTEFVDHQQVVLDQLAKEVRRLQLKGRGMPPP